MGLPRLSIKHPVTTLMVMLIAIVLGVVSLIQSPMELMPKINPPVAVVMTVCPGASPQEVAGMVTEPLEGAVATTAGIKDISSSSQENMSMIILQFNWGTNMSEVRMDLQERIDRIHLPDGAQKPSLIKFDPSTQPVMTLSAATGADLTELKGRLETEVLPRLERVDGVASVAITGAPDREIQVLLNQAKLQQYGLTQSQVSSIMSASNLTYPAGKVSLDEKSLNLRIVGKMERVDELKSLIITQVPDLPAAAAGRTGAAATMPGAASAMPGGAAAMPAVPLKAIRLGDVAEVVDGYSDATVINRTNGKPSLQITVQKEGEANTAQVAAAVAKELDKIEQDQSDLDLVITMNQGDLITASVKNVTSSLLGGGLLAVLVLLFFLRNLRPTLIIGVAIPFSVIVTFVLMYFQNLTLNIMSLGGLALGVGMLVDNAIVVIENIYRHLNELGEDPYTAAEKGANEVAGAITSSTLTTVAVFLPVVFVGGLTGELFKELALTVTFSLIASLAVALTVIPMMAARFLKAQKLRSAKAEQKGKGSLYTRSLRWALGHRAVTLLVAAAVFAGSLALVPSIGTEFLPTMDQGAFSITVKLPHGTPLATTASKVEELAGVVEKNAQVELLSTSAGSAEGLSGGMGGGGGSNNGKISVTLKKGVGPTPDVIKAVRLELEKIQGDASLSYNLDSAMNMGGAMESSTVQFTVSGPDQAKVRELVGQVQDEMKSVDGLVNIENNLDSSKPELQVVVDREKAMKAGMPPAQVAMTVADAVKGKIVTRFEEGGKATDVRVLYRAEDRGEAAKVEELLLKSPMGQTIPLKAVAEVKEAFGPVSITRENQKVSAQITGMIEGRDLGTVSQEVAAKVKALSVPAGYTVKAAGAAQMMSEGFSGLGIALLMAVLLIYMIMAAQFESLLHPFTIMFSMPLAVVGVVVGLWASGYALGITAMIGIIILAGIVVNNGIVLVDFVNQLREGGMALTEAIVEAGRTRIRPIFMTALTTILGLLPLAIGIGEGAEIQAPMAIAVIGGLITSTLLTLIVVPVVYHLFAGKRDVATPTAGSTANSAD